MSSEHIINPNLVRLEWSFPMCISDNYFKSDFYRDLKDNFPNFNTLEWSEYGQLHRKNIRINSLDDIEKTKLHESYGKLFKYFNSLEFKRSMYTNFKHDLESNGFIGNFDTAELDFNICEATDGYENPFHVDVRKRIIHVLFYFGKDEIIEGGELAIAKHKKLSKIINYPQYPNISDLIEIKKFDPEDNLALIVLSTPNSYHKGCATKGVRRFLYVALNNKNGSAWRHRKNWCMNKPFHVALENQN